eukprot:CAMPEP_0194208688 /NCGR_PEP_ID=MMETSP0156-20130528/7074_1 /TAXON_ID=33649 /ORGANISM="Thalassionema nitzschioides, Strain L26-B" /LENGTH=397 /DNA_ID=CAMNT_0038935711 /DNA_START=27 /DNA_END=1220 /DNA_ORIENTATION=+
MTGAAATRTADIIAYAVTVTSCQKRELVMDGASVLKHSIHLNSIRAGKSRYDYEMIAFVHEDAKECIDIFSFLNYTVYVKPIPFQIEDIRGNFRRWVKRAGCCGEKEWLKLYSYTLLQHPVVVHMDLDCLVLKPLDDLFDAMILPPAPGSGYERVSVMWRRELVNPIDAFFTRDYGMIGAPGRKKPHQVGVQGGFLVVRPNQTDFNEYISIILEGNYSESKGWGDGIGYGGYYGAGTIQGLAAYFYGHLHPERAVELNRCIYNNMVDSPYPKKYNGTNIDKPCLTMQEDCEDCRETNLDHIVTIHLTNCLKPWNCAANGNMPRLCKQQHHEWYRIRSSVEESWLHENAVPTKRHEDAYLLSILDLSLGYCRRKPKTGGFVYRPINFQGMNETSGIMI